jgi:eukaryotic-like serine/threonine-protein kinase
LHLKRTLSITAIVCLTLALATSVIAQANADWATFKADSAHSGVGTGTPILNPKLLWNRTYWGIQAWSSPAVANGFIYLGFLSESSQKHWYGIFAVNASTGKPIWLYTPQENVFNAMSLPSPAISGDLVFFGLCGVVYALNATSGNVVWSSPTFGMNSSIISSPTIVDDMVFIGSDDRNVYACNAGNGSKIWNYTTDAAVISSPAVVNQVVYINSLNTAYALDATSGGKIWNISGLGIIKSSPTVVDNVAYFGSSNNNVYALNVTNGNIIWVYTANRGLWGSPFEASPTVDNGLVFICSASNQINWQTRVYALNASNGNELWTYQIGRYPFGSTLSLAPATVGGVVYVGSLDNTLFAYNATTGKVIWSYATSFGIGTTPAIVNGVIYIAGFGSDSFGGTIYALENSQTPTDSIPEFPAAAFLPLIVAAVVILAFTNKARKNIYRKAWVLVETLFNFSLHLSTARFRTGKT